MKTKLFLKSFAVASLAIVLMQGCSKDEDVVMAPEQDAWSVRPSFTEIDARPEAVIAAHKITELQAEPVELSKLKAAGKYALVIGISDYSGTQYDLSYCDDDAKDWAALLAKKGFSVTQLLDGKATYSAIKSAVQKLASLSTSGSEIAFCYSGHGGSGNIVTSDLYYISASWFKSTFSKAASRKMTFTFDACEIGAMKTSLNATGRVVAVASSTNTYSYDGDASMRNGVFTYYQMIGFGSMGYTTVEADDAYAVSKMKSWGSKNGLTVAPSYVDSYSGNFVLGQ